MRNDQQSRTGFPEVADAVEALVLEVRIADRERFVDDQDVGPHCGGDAEGQAHLHAARVHPHRLVDVLADLGEGLDLGHQRGDLVDGEPRSCPAMNTFWRPVKSG